MVANNLVCGLKVLFYFLFFFFPFDVKEEVMASSYGHFHLKAAACLLTQRWPDSRRLKGSREKQTFDLEVMLK